MSFLANLRKKTNELLIPTGFEIVRNSYLPFDRRVTKAEMRFPSPRLTNDFLIRFAKGCDTFIDIGCNRGKFAENFEAINPGVDWILVEPIPYLMKALKEKFATRNKTLFIEGAISSLPGINKFYVTENDGQSSSLLKLGKRHIEASPDALEIEAIDVKTFRLDDCVQDLNSFESGFLKIDVQGSELDVINSAEFVLGKTRAVHVEVSTQSLYDGDSIGHAIWKRLDEHGFKLYGIDPWFRDRNSNGELLQADFFFIRK